VGEPETGNLIGMTVRLRSPTAEPPPERGTRVRYVPTDPELRILGHGVRRWLGCDRRSRKEDMVRERMALLEQVKVWIGDPEHEGQRKQVQVRIARNGGCVWNFMRVRLWFNNNKSGSAAEEIIPDMG
jgi:hypothetical protein